MFTKGVNKGLFWRQCFWCGMHCINMHREPVVYKGLSWDFTMMKILSQQQGPMFQKITISLIAPGEIWMKFWIERNFQDNISSWFTGDKSTLVQVIAWCRQATSHYPSQCWTRSLLPYGVTGEQWVNLNQSMPITFQWNKSFKVGNLSRKTCDKYYCQSFCSLVRNKQGNDLKSQPFVFYYLEQAWQCSHFSFQQL